MSVLPPPSATEFLCLSSSSRSSCSIFPPNYIQPLRVRLPVPKATFSNQGVKSTRLFASLALPSFLSHPSTSSYAVNSSELTATVGSPPSVRLTQWNLGPRHIFLLNVTACVVAVSASWLFFSAIPTILAFRKAAESVEKLLDVTAEELPDTMAAVRLSGMEISDLTMELSDLGQEITQGVRSSTRAVRVTEDRIRQLTNLTPKVLIQGQEMQIEEIEPPRLAKTARDLRESISKGRSAFGAIFGITHFARWAMSKHGKRRSS